MGRCPSCQQIFTVPTPVQPIAGEQGVVQEAGSHENSFASEAYGGMPAVPSSLLPTRCTCGSRPRLTHMPGPLPLRVVPSRRRTMCRRSIPAGKRRDHRYLLLLLVLIPLAWSTMHKDRNEFREHLDLTVKNHPELKDKLVDAALSRTRKTSGSCCRPTSSTARCCPSTPGRTGDLPLAAASPSSRWSSRSSRSVTRGSRTCC